MYTGAELNATLCLPEQEKKIIFLKRYQITIPRILSSCLYRMIYKIYLKKYFLLDNTVKRWKEDFVF